jgi:hypothetical protein
MKRSFNYTGRRDIPSGAVKIRLQYGASPRDLPRFTADLSGIAQMGLAPEARIYVEPYVGSGSTMRFAYGTVAAVHEPSDTALTDLDVGSQVLFRVKVVDESHNPCPILASANQLRPVDDKQEQDDRRSILPVRETAELGEALWRTDIQAEAGPELLINNGIPSFLERLRSEPLIQGLILPNAFERVLEFICLNEDCDDEADWVLHWTDFAEEVSGDHMPDSDDSDEIRQFIEQCVRSFCDKNKFKTLARRAITGAEDA